MAISFDPEELRSTVLGAYMGPGPLVPPELRSEMLVQYSNITVGVEDLRAIEEQYRQRERDREAQWDRTFYTGSVADRIEVSTPPQAVEAGSFLLYPEHALREDAEAEQARLKARIEEQLGLPPQPPAHEKAELEETGRGTKELLAEIARLKEQVGTYRRLAEQHEANYHNASRERTKFKLAADAFHEVMALFVPAGSGFVRSVTIAEEDFLGWKRRDKL